MDAFLHPPLPLQPLCSQRIRSASTMFHPRPRKTSSLPDFGVVSGVVIRRRGGSDSSPPLSSAISGAGVGIVVATRRSDKYTKSECSKSRTVSPFPQQTTRCPRTPQEIVWHTKPTRVRPVPPSPPLPNGSQPISRVDARTTEEVQVFLVAHQDGYRKLSDVNFISYAMIKISKCGGIYTMAIDR